MKALLVNCACQSTILASLFGLLMFWIPCKGSWDILNPNSSLPTKSNEPVTNDQDRQVKKKMLARMGMVQTVQLRLSVLAVHYPYLGTSEWVAVLAPSQSRCIRIFWDGAQA